MTLDIKQALARVVDRIDLSSTDMQDVMRALMSGQCSDAQIAAFLVAQRAEVHVADRDPAGLATLAASTGESEDTLEDMVEPYLLQLGFITRTPRGRVATETATTYVQALPQH